MKAGVLEESTSRFEALFGDPTRSHGPLSWAQAIYRDENEIYPDDALRALEGFEVPRHQVPISQGGLLRSFEQSYALSRCLSRRDMSVALSAAMQSWSHLAWIAGTPEQRRKMSSFILANGYPCLAASEERHGADLLASEVTARATETGFELDGEKWPIGLGSSSTGAFVLARSEGMFGYRSLSWYFVEKKNLPAGTVVGLPKVKTLGLRSSDLSGLAFRKAPLPSGSRIGKEGEGFELTLKLFQITRTLVPGLAVGAADTALRVATAFADQRILYGKPATAIPHVRELLVSAYADLLAADALMISCMRGMHIRPDELSVTSLIAKVMVPELTGRVIRQTAEVLGARFYLREGFAEGIFQKMLRDHEVIGLFDGSTSVCLNALSMQIHALLRQEATRGTGEGREARLRLRFDLSEPLPELDYSGLELIARGSDDVLQGVPESSEVSRRATDLASQVNALSIRSPSLMAHAHQYARLHAAAACIGIHSRRGQAPDWLAAALNRLLSPERLLSEALSPEAFESMLHALLQSVREPRMLSILSTQLPADGPIDLRSAQNL